MTSAPSRSLRGVRSGDGPLAPRNSSPSGSSRCRSALAFAALFLAPLLLLVGVSFFNDDKITQPGFGSWIKFFGDPFNYKVIADTLLLGVKTVVRDRRGRLSAGAGLSRPVGRACSGCCSSSS